MDALASGYGLIEAPVWVPGEGLYWSDVLHGGVYRRALTGEVTTAIPHRRGIGGMARHAEGGLVVGGRNIAFKSLTDGRSAVLLEPSIEPDVVGFNDLTTDAAGRIYVGSLAFRVFAGDAPRPGHLHMIDLDGRARTIAHGVLLTNGLAFSPDGKRLYQSDSRGGLIRAYDVADDGSVGDGRVFAHVTGTPDGMAVASDGSVWVALAEAGAVAVFSPDGIERMRLAVPLPMVTSLCFGGEDLRDLYVVTGSRGGPHERCGSVFVTRVDVPGLLRPLARVALGPSSSAEAPR
jgi:gluconolactonase